MEGAGLVLDALSRMQQYQPLPTLSIRLASVINCNTRHAGQIPARID